MSQTPLSVSGAAPLVTPECPWLGLAAFTAECRDYFYGRDAEIRELADRAKRAALTVLYGVSGYGKSSLLGAGLIPELRDAGHPVVFLRRCYDDLPERPLTGDILADVVREIPGTVLPGGAGAASEPAGDAAPQAVSLWEFFHDRRQPWCDRTLEEEDSAFRFPVLVLDQFEEIFVKGEDCSTGHPVNDGRAREHARIFLTELADLVENRPPAALRQRLEKGNAEEKRALLRRFDFQSRPVRMVVALREDYLGRLERWRRTMPGMMEHRIELRLLSGPQAFRAVFEPGTKRPGLPPIIAPDIAASIVRAAAGADPECPLEEIKAVPPILSLLCERLNARRFGPEPRTGEPQVSISSADFAPGEASRILADFYAEKTRRHPRALCEFLEDALASESGLRETVTLDSALSTLGSAADVRTRLQALVEDRILLIEERNGIARLEFSHDTLARLAVVRRSERHLRRRRRRALAWTSAALAVAGISLALMFWALRERRRAITQTAVADAERTRARQQLQEASRSDVAAAQARMDEGKWQEACAYLGRAVRYDPDNQEAQDTLWMAIRYGRPDASTLLLRSLPPVNGLRSAAYSPDGSLVLTIGDDDTARLWNAETGKPVAEPMRHAGPGGISRFGLIPRNGFPKTPSLLTGKTPASLLDPLPENPFLARVQSAIKPPLKAGFSPDGSRIVTFGTDHAAMVWDAQTGRQAGPPLAHQDKVEMAVFNADRSRVATASSDKTARIWDLATGKPEGFGLPHASAVHLVAFSPDGTRVATAAADNAARIWNAAQGSLVATVQHRSRITAVSFSPDNSRLLTASWDGAAQVWDAASGQPAGTPMSHGASFVDFARFSPEGTRVVTTDWNHAAHLWDAATGTSIGSAMEHAGSILSVCFSADGTRVLTASADRKAQIWDASTGKPLGPPFRHRASVWSAAFSPDGTKVLTAEAGGTAHLWQAGWGQSSGLSLAHRKRVRSADLSPDGMRMVTACDDGAARVWRVLEAAQPEFVLKHESFVTDAEFSPDGARILTASWDQTARQWSARDGQPLGAPLKHDSHVEFARYSPDGRRILTGTLKSQFSKEGDVTLLWDAESGSNIARFPNGSSLLGGASLTVGDFSPDGGRFLSGDSDGIVRVWNGAGNLPAGPVIRHKDRIFGARFSGDGSRIFTAGGGDAVVRIWNAVTGETVGGLENGGVASWLQCSRDRSRLLTVSSSGVRFWDVQSQRGVGIPICQDAGIEKAGFSPDGSFLVTAGGDFTARIWRLTSGETLDGSLAGKLVAACAGAKMDRETAALRVLPAEERARLLQLLVSSLAGKPQWQAAVAALIPGEPTTRLVFPPASVTQRDAATNLISTLNPAAIREALLLDPAHPLLPFACAHIETADPVLAGRNPKRAVWLIARGRQQLPPAVSAPDLRLAAQLVAEVAKTVPEQKAAALDLLDRAAALSAEDESSAKLRVQLASPQP
ncbi:MAG: hypothetical protein KA004_00990 [Verrucomicrobiales bacterium]|nr:hypothetical protein [Verrucomicrobiales bacterium]